MARYSQPRLLCVDDDIDTLSILRTALKKSGFEVSTATNWDEVTDRLSQIEKNGQKYDLIVLDIMMPDRSGYDVLRSLQLIMHPMPPVIFLSAKCAIDDMVKASDLGAAMYVVKPTTPVKLVETIQDVLSRHRS